MRLDRVYIDGFKNLNDCFADFDEDRLTTVIIGQNGAGKSNLIEAIVDVFRFVDFNRAPPRYQYEIEYRIDGTRVILSNRSGKPTIQSDGITISRKEFDKNRENYFPELVFGYYSGGSRRLEGLFDSHQRRYYDAIKINDDLEECQAALRARRLFYCRPIHGNFALMSFFAQPAPQVERLLKEMLGITGFHSALTVFRQPWFSNIGKRSAVSKAKDLWDAKGPAGICGRAMRDLAFHPFALTDNPIDDYRAKSTSEVQLGVYFRDRDSLVELSKQYQSDQDLFYALEAMDISDLIRELHLWVTRTNNDSGDVSFHDLSDGERQLLMVLGLIRVSRGKRSLFLLDEPDTHLNPHWQHSYLQLIREWTDVAADDDTCHIIMTSHNPLTISSLDKEEVRIMSQEESGKVSVGAPYTNPHGLGFTATLTEIFGMPTSVDLATQRQLDERNLLLQIADRTEEQDKKLVELNDKLDRLGFMFEDREPLYQDFLRSWQDVRYADRPPMTPGQIESRRNAMNKLVKHLLASKGGDS